jgi:hypothetical protein
MLSPVLVDTIWGRARAVDLLERSTAWLQAEVRAGRWHTLLAPRIGGLSALCEQPALRAIAERVLREAPPQAFAVGAITNMPHESLVRRELPEGAALDERFPVYGEEVLCFVRGCADPHIQLALAERTDEAWSRAQTPLAREECASTCAVMGNVAVAMELIARHEFPAERWIGPAMVICVESFRGGDLDRASIVLDEILAGRSGCWEWTQLAAGLIGRVPWGGYPFPDY